LSDSRETSNFAKDVRRGVIEIRGVGGKKRQDKPVVVETRWPGCFIKAWQEWHTWRRYATTELAETAIQNARRKSPSSEYRIKPDA
jgi:hypothetical protein